MKKILCFLFFGAVMSGIRGQIITTVAGNGTNGFSGDGGPATLAELSSLSGLTVDSIENIYVTGTNSIRKITYKTGIISKIAGNRVSGYSGDGGQATSAEIAPTDIVMDGKGNLYFTQGAYDVIRKINFTTGVITTIAGNGVRGYAGDGGHADSAELDSPFGLTVDAMGNIYVVDGGNYRIREINNATGIITTVGGNGYTGYSGDGGPAISAELRLPEYVKVNNSGSIYISDRNACVIRKIDNSGIISTIAGVGYSGFSGDGGQSTLAELNCPQGIALDDSGNIYLSDANNYRIRKIDYYTSIIHTIAGAINGFSGDGGNPLNAELDNPLAIAVDKTQNICIADYGNGRLREIWQGPLAINVNISNPLNCSVCNGTASVNVSNGYQPYTYQWSQGGTNSFVSGLCTGYDSLIVTDSLGFSIKQVVTIGHPLSDIITSTISNCANNSGKASVLPVGGVTPFSILWSNGGTGTLITGLSSGTYSVTITDSLGCSKSDSVFVPLGITITAVQTNFPKCNAPLDGEAKVTSIGGGMAPYTYSWLPSGGNGINGIGLSAGNYTVTITDANGCSGKDSVTITQAATLKASFGNYYSVSTCNYNFEIQPTVTGGSPPFSYLWSPSGSTYDTTKFYFPGIYSVTVTDAYGCIDTVSENIINSEIAGSHIELFKNVTCFGGNNGSVIVFPATLKGPTETWYPIGTNPSALSAGTYTLVIQDLMNDCSGAMLITVTQPPLLVANAYIIQNVSCYGGSDGSAGTTVSGGTPPYTFFWPNLQTTSTATGLKAIAYTTHVTDSNACTAMSTVIITQPPAITLSTDSIPDNGGCNGKAWAMAGGGSPPFNYMWTGGLTTDTIQNQCAGYYCVLISDQNGCLDSSCVTIPSNIFTGNAINLNSGGIDVFPNPNKGIFNFQISNTEQGIMNVEVYNVFGQLVYTQFNIQNPRPNGSSGRATFKIDLRSKSNGVYYFRVEKEPPSPETTASQRNGEIVGTGKIVIEK